MDVLRELEKVFLVFHKVDTKKENTAHKDTEAQRKIINVSRKDSKTQNDKKLIKTQSH